jgi:acyl carrier protein
MNDVSLDLKGIIQKIKPNIEFGESQRLKEDLDFDSLDLINFYFEVEKAFDIRLSEDEIAALNVSTVSEIFGFICSKSGR